MAAAWVAVRGAARCAVAGARANRRHTYFRLADRLFDHYGLAGRIVAAGWVAVVAAVVIAARIVAAMVVATAAMARAAFTGTAGT